MAKNDGGLAYPDAAGLHPGMTLRDYFAGQVLAGIMSQGTVALPDKAAGCAYLWADAMLEVRGKKEAGDGEY